jgi:hypothetical protein
MGNDGNGIFVGTGRFRHGKWIANTNMGSFRVAREYFISGTEPAVIKDIGMRNIYNADTHYRYNNLNSAYELTCVYQDRSSVRSRVFSK